MGTEQPKVIIIGGGFGGLTAARSLKRAPVQVTLIDRRNHHLFQPLLYQVAMAGLSPAEIATPIRSIVHSQQNVDVILGEVVGVELQAKTVTLGDGEALGYDYLIIAAGAATNYFGNDQWEPFALGLKSIEDAIEIRRRVLLRFEEAERLRDPTEQAARTTFVVIGGGPTGVELAGALAELAQRVLARDFRHINASEARILLLEGGDRLLAGMDAGLSDKAKRQLEGLGVEVRLGAMVQDVDEVSVQVGGERIASGVTIWAAGVRANDLTGQLGIPLARGNKIPVTRDCSLVLNPEVFAIGDIAEFIDDEGKPLPAVSPVAMQQARSVAANIERTIAGEERVLFRYFDKGSMATIGRSRAVAQTGRLRLSGLIAWLAWLFIHIWYLIGFRNRVFVLLQWFWSYVMYRRGARLITTPTPAPEPAQDDSSA